MMELRGGGQTMHKHVSIMLMMMMMMMIVAAAMMMKTDARLRC